MKTKLLALLLALVLTLPVLVACGEKETKKPEKTNPTGSTGTEEKNEFQYIDDYVANLANENSFDGEDFMIIGGGLTIYPEKEEETGVLEMDALYKSVRDLEVNFGVDIQFIAGTGEGFNSVGEEVADRVYNDQAANLLTYDLVEGNLMVCGRNLLSKNVLMDVADNDYLDFSKSWWLNGLEDQFGIQNRLFFLTGKIANSHYQTACAVLFNKNTAKQFDINGADLYQYVTDKTWTLDKMMEVASVVPANSGIYKVIVRGASGGLMYFFGGGFTLCQTDPDGNLSIPSTLTPEQSNYIDKLARIFGDTTSTLNANDPTYIAEHQNDPDDYDHELETFIGNKALFNSSSIGGVAELRTHDVEFGILPIPLSSTEQKNYIAFSSAYGVRGVFFPKNVKDITKTSVITEAYAALGEKNLEPAYYETALQGRSTYDEESKVTVEILYNSKFIDLADTYQFGAGRGGTGDALVDVINDACLGIQESYTSKYTSSATIANKQDIKSLMNAVAKYK